VVRAHDEALAAAFDDQAARFERAPVQSDPEALRRLVAFAELPSGSRLLDAGCGPGLVAEAFLEAGHTVVGIDLSAEMVERARRRCERFGDRARFFHGSVFELDPGGPFDAAVSRYVLHHADDPLAFLARQVGLLRPGGVVVASDHTTDPDPGRQGWHQEIERLRDRTHTRNLTPAGLIDLFTRAGLAHLAFREEAFELDFDEWFDRGTPAAEKATVRAMVLRPGRDARGFSPREQPGGTIALACWRALVRGTRPQVS
jgi:SAM-dependent methyltransferase